MDANLESPAFTLTLPPDLLRPLVREVVLEVLEQLKQANAAVEGANGQFAFGEIGYMMERRIDPAEGKKRGRPSR